MLLSLNEIKDRALAFFRDWEGTPSERAEYQTIWNEFFDLFGEKPLSCLFLSLSPKSQTRNSRITEHSRQ
jgi:hypothetical protein